MVSVQTASGKASVRTLGSYSKTLFTGWVESGEVGRGEDGVKEQGGFFFCGGFFVPCFSGCKLSSDLGKKTGTSGVQKSRGMGKNWEDECMIISYTKERSKKEPTFGH